MEPEKILELLTEAEVTQADIADELKIRSPTVNRVIHKKQNSRRVQDLVCEKIGKTFEEVWG